MLFDIHFIITGILYFTVNNIFDLTFQVNTERNYPLKEFYLEIRFSL